VIRSDKIMVLRASPWCWALILMVIAPGSWGAPFSGTAPEPDEHDNETSTLTAAADRLSRPAQALEIYSIELNQTPMGDATVLRTAVGGWWVRREDLLQWRLQPPAATPMRFRGSDYFPLSAYSGAVIGVIESQQVLKIELPPRYFTVSMLGQQPQAVERPTPSKPGGFVNYDLVLNSTADQKRLDGQYELGFFHASGVGTSNFLVRDMGGQPQWTRLDTTWTRDDPDQLKSFTLGDTIGVSGLWGKPVRFAGLRYGTNFATRPGYVTFARPQLAGETALPSTAELFVDGVRRQGLNISPGPFQLNQLPVVTGQGEVKLVMKDLLGREQVLVQPYLASSTLLAKGLEETSYELGTVRNNYGTRSDDYGSAQATAQWRRGISDSLTGEFRAELMKEQQSVGLGATRALVGVGMLSAATAISQSEAGFGRTLLASYDRPSQRGIQWGVRGQWMSSHFTQLGWPNGKPAPLRTLVANAGFALDGRGSLGVNFIRQDQRAADNQQIVSASYTLNMGSTGVLIATAFKSLTSDRSHAVSLIFSTSFGARGTASVNHTRQASAPSTTLQAQENVPTGDGTGYRLLHARDGADQRTELGFSVQNRAGLFSVDAAQGHSTTSYRLNATGGIGLIEGRAFLTRRLYDGFGLVHLPGFVDAGVLVNNELVGRTDAQGYVPLPWLLAYQPNQISIQAEELPLNTELRRERISVTPFAKSGLLIEFPVAQTNGAVLVLTHQDGSPVPTGTVVKKIGSDETFNVALRGEVYVTGLRARERLQATWRDQRCEFEVTWPSSPSPIPRLGPLLCKMEPS